VVKYCLVIIEDRKVMLDSSDDVVGVFAAGNAGTWSNFRGEESNAVN